jgi:MFS family permease
MSGAATSPAMDDGARLSVRRMLVPLALAQFICSYAGSNMNVAITSIGADLDTTVRGVQTAITLFLLTMAVLMIPGSKLTDRWGRKRCFVAGLTLYGTGALVSAIAPNLGILILGYSALEGVGSALLIPPVYILTTVLVTDPTARARAFGLISGMAGIGAAAGPLIGGLITTTISWRASFLLQAAVVGAIVLLSRRIVDPLPADASRRFDVVGAVLSGLGLFFFVTGILLMDSSWVWTIVFAIAGVGFLAWFVAHVRRYARAGREPLLSVGLFRNRTSNLALVTQNLQWLLLMGLAFVVSVYLQVELGYSAIATGLVFTAATAGILATSLAAERFATRRSQATLIRLGFLVALAGIGLLLLLVRPTSDGWAFVPGLLTIGVGIGAMLTPSVNVVQSSFPEALQGEISGVSRSVSNLGSSLGTAIGGTILASDLASGTRTYGLALMVLAAFGFVGLIVAIRLPSGPRQKRPRDAVTG